MTDGRHVIGLIADTHGLVRPDVFTALEGVELILHAGDVGQGVFEELETIAPVQAVYGNTDLPGDARLVQSIEREIGGVRIHVSHGHELGSPTPARLLARYDADVIVYGHTHESLLRQVEGRWVVNPGAAGPRRFSHMPSVARMTIDAGEIEMRIIELKA